MRRLHDRRPATFFRGAEFARLLTLVAMLGVLFMLMQRAGDPQTWKWFAPDDTVAQAPSLPERLPPKSSAPRVGPTDSDPLEQDAAREELAAIADRVPLAADEMPAYWRLWAWQSRQTAVELQKRADKKVTFRDLWNEPKRYRGKLVEFPVHLRRTLTVDDVAQNDLGVQKLYEVFGWNTSSQPNWYWMVVGDLPPSMPSGDNVYEEATFVGYFLKLLPYEDHEGHTRATPLLIGRLIWHPTPSNPLAGRDDWQWTWYLAAALLSLFVIRWGLVLWGRTRIAPSMEESVGSADDQAVEAWLTSDSGPAENAPEDDNSGTPWTEDPEEN